MEQYSSKYRTFGHQNFSHYRLLIVCLKTLKAMDIDRFIHKKPKNQNIYFIERQTL